jgi:ketosteroid isomerase-like protein
MAEAVASWAFKWRAENLTVWREGDVSWAQILGSVRTRRNGMEEDVPYWTTAVFARGANGWEWRYWGGAEPQPEPRV